MGPYRELVNQNQLYPSHGRGLDFLKFGDKLVSMTNQCHYCGDPSKETDKLGFPICWDCHDQLKKTQIKIESRRKSFINRELNKEFLKAIRLIPYWGNMEALDLPKETKDKLAVGHAIIDALRRRINHSG
jgi:hypothetical protein